MKNSNAVKYLFISLVLYGLLLGGQLLLDHFTKLYSYTYQGIFWTIGVIILTPLLVGLLLGVEKLLAVPKQQGLWKVNWWRMVILGVPALIIIANFVLSFLGVTTPMYKFIKWPILLKSEFIMSSSLILGYVLGSSFSRENRENQGDGSFGFER